MVQLIRVRDVGKVYCTIAGVTAVALAKVSFSIEEGECITVIGPSGCGKTTLLRLLAGFEQPSTGEIVFKGGCQPRTGFVFQGNTVFPWRNVERNLTYSSEIRAIPRDERHRQATRIAELVGLDPAVYLNKYPRELSGGEVRRVAIGMALAHQANLLLMDEPTSQLDHFMKLQMQETVQSIWKAQGVTVVYITHDIDEAIFLGNRVFMLDRGRLLSELFIQLDRPRSREIIGSGAFGAYKLQILDAYHREFTTLSDA